MAYVERYRIKFLNASNNMYQISIYEDGYAGDVTLLEGDGEPAVIQLIDNDEQVYSPVQKTDLTIGFISDSNFSLRELFEAGGVSDTTFKVELTLESNLIWTGYLDTESCYEAVEDDPRQISLRAVDGLGFLSRESFLDHDDEFPYGKYTLLQLIEWCLAKTGLELDLQIFCEVFEETMSDAVGDHPFDQVKVHTRYLETANCFDVLFAICRTFAATLYQANGCWVIERKHDRWDDRTHNGVQIAYPYTTETPEAIELHFVHTTFDPVENNHRRYLLPPNSLTKVTYNYTIPDIPRNRNFLGDFLAPVSGPDNTANEIDNWLYQYDAVSAPITVATTPYRNVVFDPTTRKIIDQYIVLPRNAPTDLVDERLIAESVQVSKDDKVQLSFEHRFKFDVSGSGSTSAAQLILYGNSGQKYTLDDNTVDINQQATWTPTLTSAVGQIILRTYGSGEDLTEWLTMTTLAQGFPEDGYLALWLYEGTPSVTGNETWFRNVRLTLQLFVNDRIGIRGEQTVITQNEAYRGQTEIDITMGDAPKPTINGAFFRGSDDDELTGLWHIPAFPDDEVPLMQLTNRAFHQLYHRFKTKLEGSVDTVQYDHPDSGKTIIQPNVEMIYAPSTMAGIRYIPTNFRLMIGEDRAEVMLMEFYKNDEEENPLGDSETINYLYQ